MHPRTRKALSWSVSAFIHVGLLFLLGRAALQYALPEGDVTSPTTFEVVGGNGGEQTEVKTPVTEQDKTAPALPRVKAPKTHAVHAEKDDTPVKFLPDKNFNEVRPTEPDAEDSEVAKKEEPAPEKIIPQTVPKKNEQVKNEDEAIENTENVPQTIPAKEETAEQPPAATPAAVEKSAAKEVSQNMPPTNDAKSEKAGGEKGGDDSAPPPFGTPGTTLDISKLVEANGNPKPRYPLLAKFRHQEGLVLIRAYVRKDGHVDLPILEKSSGFAALDNESLSTFAHWRFQPGPSGWVIKPFQFQLKK